MADVKDEGKEKLEAQVKSVDMSEDMQQEAIEVGGHGQVHDREGKHPPIYRQPTLELEPSLTASQEIAHHIKRTFDERKGATWHCIVGRNFGSFVTHETKHFIYFYLGHCAILLFKTQ